MFDVCVVGSANLDLVARAPHLPRPGETVLGSGFAEHPGGKGLNQAVAASRSGARTAFVGCVGPDHAGRTLRRVAIDEDIDVTGLVEVDAATGRALIGVDDAAENSIIVVPGANGRVDPRHVADAIPRTAVVLAQLEIPLDAVRSAFTVGKALGARTVLNPAPAISLTADVLSLCDLLVPNEGELHSLGGADALLASGVSAIVVTLGARGARVLTAAGADMSVPSFPVSPIDTTGAGDAFCGALSARLAAGDDLSTAVRYATAAGALATTVAGAVPSLPHREAVERLLTGGV